MITRNTSIKGSNGAGTIGTRLTKVTIQRVVWLPSSSLPSTEILSGDQYLLRDALLGTLLNASGDCHS
jgi:hypothetical protein